MGKEIRRVDADWEHPKMEGHNDNYKPLHNEDYESALSKWVDNYNLWKAGNYPQQKKAVAFSKLMESAHPNSKEFQNAYELLHTGEHPDQEELMKNENYIYEYPYWKWEDYPPDPNYYMPKPFKNPTWFQMYENVSEGTPISPKFETKEELVDYLVTNGDFWDQETGKGGWERKNAEYFVNQGFAFSGIITGSGKNCKIIEPRDDNGTIN